MNTTQSTSSRRDVSFASKVGEWVSHFRMRLAARNSSDALRGVEADVNEYAASLKEHCGRELREERILEIGYGARPLRMFYLTGMGYRATGIDLDRPVLRGVPREFLRILKGNGLERMLKSIVRHYAFDVAERRQFARQIAGRGGAWRVDPAQFVVGDASADDGQLQGEFGLIFSEDVFEHIAEHKLVALAARLHARLAPAGLCLVRLNLFTGITGGHLTEWYPHTLKSKAPRRSAPWEHLRQRRYRANTFLNGVRLARYREIFRQHFEICQEKVIEHTQGRDFLTPEVRADLAEYTEEELLTNNILFVLKPRRF